MLLVVGGAAAAVAALIGIVLVPAPLRRGVTVALAVTVLVFGVASTAPSLFQDLARFGAEALLALGILTGGRRERQSPAVVVIGIVFVVLVETVTVLAFPLATLLFAHLALLAVLVLISVSGFTQRERRLFLGAVIALALVQAALGVLEFTVVHHPLPWGYVVRSSGKIVVLQNTLLPGGAVRVSGSLGHPIPYATLLAIALSALVLTRRRRSTARTVLIAAALLAGVLLSGSRSVLIAIVIAGAYVVWTSPASGRFVRVLVVTLGAAIAAVVFGADLRAAATRLLESGSFWNRTDALASVPALLRRSPLETLFGSGFGSDYDLYARGFLPQKGFFVVDNQLVTSIATQGVVGAALVIALIGVAFVQGDRLRRALVLVMATMLFSFDYFGWPAMFILLMACVALPRDRGSIVADADGTVRRPTLADDRATAPGRTAR